MSIWNLIIEETKNNEGIVFRVDKNWKDRGSERSITQEVFVCGLNPIGKPKIYLIYQGVNRGSMSGFSDEEKPSGTLVDYAKSPELAEKRAYDLALRSAKKLKKNEDYQIIDNTSKAKKA